MRSESSVGYAIQHAVELLLNVSFHEGKFLQLLGLAT